ncbi:MAG: acetyltransferase [Halobacteriales archaeon]|nr:acetyltransferase [Halobacteriales archaeon]
MTRLVLLGAGSFAAEVADVVEDAGFTVAAFVDEARGGRGEHLLGKPILDMAEAAPLRGGAQAVCALGTTRRQGFVERAAKAGFAFATVVHPTARVARSARLAGGCVVGPMAVLSTEASLGRHVLVNRGVLLGHHARVGDFATLSPGANVGGAARIGEAAYIGMGAVVLQGLAVGSRSVVGAGSVVTKDVPERVQVLGVPARVVKEDVEGY